MKLTVSYLIDVLFFCCRIFPDEQLTPVLIINLEIKKNEKIPYFIVINIFCI